MLEEQIHYLPGNTERNQRQSLTALISVIFGNKKEAIINPCAPLGSKEQTENNLVNSAVGLIVAWTQNATVAL